ncbi:MAG: glycosyltransferase family 39 protein [Spirochaetia bacterium]|nr:glycosyltransferase family 39 protein [Spirochaetia bacterium]
MKQRTKASQHSSKLLLALSIFVLVILVRINYSILPFTWPDEALFSSPALELAEGRVFSTRVLSGLIHGMDRATLWNGPLYMVLLSGVYAFTGESQLAGRTFSLLLGAGTLCIFFLLTRRLTAPFAAAVATFALALDPVFQRAANTIRMDILTLLLLLTSVYLLVRASADTPSIKEPFPDSRNRSRWLGVFLAGIAAGLAGTSHPFAVIAVPILFVLLFPNWKELILAAIGTIIGFAPWGLYILGNLDLFKEQFIPQLVRKESFLRMLTGGETGGVLKVYFSQYGFSHGSWPAMVIGGLLYSFVVLLVLAFLHKRFWSKSEFRAPSTRILICFLIISGFALLSSEGWYVVYGDVFLILVVAILWHTQLTFDFHRFIDTPLNLLTKFSLPITICAMFFLSGYYTIRHRLLKTTETAQTFLESTIKATAQCESVYVRIRPDPYFLFRRERPEMRVLEFIPGKLKIKPERMHDLIATLDSVDCFLIDRNKSWEPLLTSYLYDRSSRFQVRPIRTQFPVDDVDLYIRKKHGH